MHDSDDRLLEELRAVAARVDAAPGRMLTAARASYAWRTIDAELAELAYDSAVATRPLAGVRGTETPRVLTFSAPECGLTIEIEVTPAAGVVEVVGQLVPAGHARLEIRHGGGSESVEADELGRFAIERVHAGPFSIRCTRAAADLAVVTTDWTTL
jgi:hypothetical protein